MHDLLSHIDPMAPSECAGLLCVRLATFFLPWEEQGMREQRGSIQSEGNHYCLCSPCVPSLLAQLDLAATPMTGHSEIMDTVGVSGKPCRSVVAC